MRIFSHSFFVVKLTSACPARLEFSMKWSDGKLLLKACVKCKICLDEIMPIMQNNSADSPRRVDAICGINQQMAYATIGKKWLAYS